MSNTTHLIISYKNFTLNRKLYTTYNLQCYIDYIRTNTTNSKRFKCCGRRHKWKHKWLDGTMKTLSSSTQVLYLKWQWSVMHTELQFTWAITMAYSADCQSLTIYKQLNLICSTRAFIPNWCITKRLFLSSLVIMVSCHLWNSYFSLGCMKNFNIWHLQNNFKVRFRPK